MDLTIEAGTQDIFTKESIIFCFRYRLFKNVNDPCIFTPDINVCMITAKCIRGYHQSFNQQVARWSDKITFNQIQFENDVSNRVEHKVNIGCVCGASKVWVDVSHVVTQHLELLQYKL